ncbi:putative Regulatory protein, TetR [Frankia canadensis]|uniref:Putative Regulatory protein, TetR n=1 Tax=Frankia canadensis TaxID=1836972 RepID=A0A2I2KLN5_9ACTN|nr:TetR/AcrR family transcriptional regulator [Frankia canadensis]SNQ46570.1 putative Regulatory protein, TetR [Frankia canadensis]SOU53860.1 putative Regulatory protein, TetR [Frankia canadensis]
MTTPGRAGSAPDDRQPAMVGRRPRADADETRLQLLRAAERLFAERGIEAVSLRDIHQAAGQRNTSAVNYHFGGKEGLIRAIIEARADVTNARRMQLLAQAEASGRGEDARSLVDALVWPLAEEIRQGTYYVGFLSRLIVERDLDRPVRYAADPVWSSAVVVGRRLRSLLAHVDRSVFDLRFRLAFDLVVHALATEQAAGRRGGPDRLLPLDAYVTHLADAVTGLLSAPGSAADA